MTNTYHPPKRFFEEQGFVSLESCYLVSLENVVNTKNQNIQKMVNLGRFFTIFAPRQSGKTTFFYDFCRSIEHDPLYIAILFSFQTCQNLTGEQFYQFIDENLKEQIHDRLTKLNCKEFNDVMTCMNEFPIKDHTSFYRLFKKFNSIIHQKKIVIFIDEFDGMPLSELENFLMVLRDLYQNYKHTQKKALYSVGLVGIRNIAKLVVGGVSPFNIADQVNLPMFSLKNVRDLYAQYTQESHQPFTEKAVCKVYEQTCGQPWMVNRLGTILTINIKPQTTDPIDETDVDAAIKILLKESNSHFDNLFEKIHLYHDAFMNIFQHDIAYDPNDKAQSWLKQYGLIKESNAQAIIANPIYHKRFLSLTCQKPSFEYRNAQKIFISYSHEDRLWLDKLLPFLKVLKMNGIDYWYDEHIGTGNDWSLEIQNAIETAGMTICILTNNFLSSEFIQQREIPELQLRQKQGMKIVPILAEDCLWNIVNWLKKIQIYPQNGISLETLAEKEQQKKFMEIVSEINEMLGK
ncbi:MAG: toll/interleukin-1 receptor domain-containing protein [Candidatus Magnetomorum sp.]|nr:toll/interleukin-1 receptor domain-containing protein [Candidatus Magnetomorum sp.]